MSRRALAWGGGLLTAGLAALVTALFVGLPWELRDVPGAKDRVRDLARGDQPLRITIVSKHYDESYSMIFADLHEATAEQQRMMTGENLTAESVVQLEREFDEAGGVPLEGELLRLQVEGRRNQQVTIVDIRPRILERAAPLSGTAFLIPSEGVATTRLGFDLDARVPEAREVPELFFDQVDKWGGRYFENFTINLKDQASETLVVGLRAEHFYVEFDLVFTYTLGGVTKTQTLDNDGRHFRITGPNCVQGTAFTSYRRGFANGAAGGWGVAAVRDPARIANDNCTRF